MLRGITELQNIRAAILTIPVKELPIIAVSYSKADAAPGVVTEENQSAPAPASAVVSAAHLGSPRGRLNLRV